MASLRHSLANIISVPVTLLKLSIKKILYPRNIFFSPIERFSPNVLIDTDRKSVVKFEKKVSIHSRGRVAAHGGGILNIRERVSINVGGIIICRGKIEIGCNVSIGPNVMMYDHDHTMSFENGVKKTPFNVGEIFIGENSWIGAGCIILAGARIGKNCIIAAGSVVKGNVPDNTILIQKRENTYKSIRRNND